jgi:hypothetical protein
MARWCDASPDVSEVTWVLSNLAHLTLCRSIQLLALQRLPPSQPSDIGAWEGKPVGRGLPGVIERAL